MELGELPEGWALERLETLANKITKGATPTTFGYDFQRSGVNFIKIQNVSHGGIDTTSIVDFISEEAHQIQKKSMLKVDDVIFSIAGTIGETAILKETHLPANTSQAFAIISGFSDFLVPKYLEFQLRSFVTQKTKEKARGGAMNNISLDDLRNLEVLVPPLAEQHRIVAKIEELFSELDQGVSSLKTAREQLKVYRQSLLKNAFEGKLTADWRAAHRDQLETATALQQRIARERQARYQQQLADWQAAGQAGHKPKAPKPLPPLTAEELAELPELPEGWGWCSVSQLLAEDLCNGKSVKDRKGGFPVLRLNALGDGKVDLSIQKEGAWTAAEAESYVVEVGDFLVSRGNGSKHLVGRGGFVSGLNGAVVAFPDTMIRIRLMSQLVELQYFGLCWDSMLVRSQIENSARTTAGIYKINQELIEAYKIPLPMDLEEQKLIVQELELKLSEADQLDQSLATALQQAGALRQSILKKAFCGQLVAQGANDEPAAVLLERIRAERARAAVKPKKSASR